MNKMTAAVALMAVLSLGICFILLGTVSSDLTEALQLDPTQFASLLTALFLTSGIVQLFVGPAVDRFGYKPVAVLGFVVTGLSIFLLAYVTTFSAAFLASVLLGVGAMSLNTVGNTLIPVVLFEGKDPARASNFGNAFFGLGYVSMPFLYTFFVQKMGMSYAASLSVFGLLMVVFLVFSLVASYPTVPIGFSLGKAVGLLARPAVLVAALALVCYISLEVSMGSWSRKLMEELLGQTTTPAEAAFRAGMVLTLFGLAMAVGRFLTSAVKNLTAIGVKVIAGAAVVSLVCILVMIWTRSAGLATLAIVLTGLAFAPIFPTVVGVTFAKFDASQYGSIFGIIFAIGLLGNTLVQQGIGKLSASGTVQGGLRVVAGMALLLVLVAPALGVGKKATK